MASSKPAPKPEPKTAPKTAATAASVADHIAARATPARHADCQVLMALLEQLVAGSLASAAAPARPTAAQADWQLSIALVL